MGQDGDRRVLGLLEARLLLAYLFVDVVFSFNPSSVGRRRDA